MKKDSKQVCVILYSDTRELLEEAMNLSGNLQTPTLRTAVKLGLEQIVAMHKRNQIQA